MTTIQCLTCKKDTTNPKFCSRSCAAKLNNQQTPKRTKLTRTCGICHEEFIPIYKEKRCVKHPYIGKPPVKKITRDLCKADNCINIRSSNRLYCNEHKGGLKAHVNSYINDTTLGDVMAKLKFQHPSWVMSYARQRTRQSMKDLRKLPCENCGYSKHVELCHIKPIKSFSMSAKLSEINARENIKVLCPNCHWEFDNGLIVL